jgi:hypothetical protein
VNHLPTISARGLSCPSKYQDRALRPVSVYMDAPSGSVSHAYLDSVRQPVQGCLSATQAAGDER